MVNDAWMIGSAPELGDEWFSVIGQISIALMMRSES
jgi:hypothetical protein